jgi:hypothetical protein
MIVWNHEFDQVHKKAIMEFLEPYETKLIVIKNSRDIERLFMEGNDFI